MKKLLFGLIATVMFGFVGNAQTRDEATVKIPLSDKTLASTSGKIKIHLEIGRPRRDCLGLWICKGTVDIEVGLRSADVKNDALVMFDNKNRTATLYVQNLDTKNSGLTFQGEGEDYVSFDKFGVIVPKNYEILPSQTKIDNILYNYKVVMQLQ